MPVVDVETASVHPDLAVLSLLAHRDTSHGLAIGKALLAACDHLDPERGRLYTDVVFNFLSAASRAALEAEMNLEKYEVRSEFMRRLEAEAIQLGREKGREEGREEARAEARVALARALVRVLERRGFTPTAAHRAAIDDCRDVAQLDEWLLRAAVATELAAVFDDER